MIKIFYWDPKGGYFGHLSMQLSDGTYISYWPSKGQKGKKKKRGKTQSFNDDVEAEGRAPDKTVVLAEDIVNQAAIKSWWSTYVENTHYNLLTHNCALVVKKALEVGGIYRSEYVRFGASRLGRFMIWPWHIFQWAVECTVLFLGQKNGKRIPPEVVREITDSFKS